MELTRFKYIYSKEYDIRMRRFSESDRDVLIDLIFNRRLENAILFSALRYLSRIHESGTLCINFIGLLFWHIIRTFR